MQTLSSGQPPTLLIAQQASELLGIRSQHRQGHGPFKTIPPMVSNPFEAVAFQMVDRRLDARVPPAPRLEPWLRLTGRGLRVQVALHRQRAFIKKHREVALVAWRAELLAKAVGYQLLEVLLRLGHHPARRVDIMALPHDPMMQDELILVLHHAPRPCPSRSSACAARRSRTPSHRGGSSRPATLGTGSDRSNVRHAP